MSEDCATTLPAANCTLDENTTADLTIDNGVTLSVGSSVTIGHTINGDDALGDGAVETFGAGTSVNQTADIGGITPIDSLTIADDNTWTSSATINTNNDGSDIDLGVADGGETLNLNSGASYSGEIDGHNNDTVNFGSDGNGGEFATGGQIETVSIIVTSGSLDIRNTVGGGIALGGVNVTDGSTLTIGANTTTDGALNNDGTIRIESGNTLSANAYTADADAGAFIIEVARGTGTTETGQLSVATGGPLDLSSDNIVIAIADSSEVLIDQTIANAIIGNTAASIGPNSFQDNSFLYDFAFQANGNNFDLVVTVNPIGALSATSNNNNVAQTILTNLGTLDSGEVNTVHARLGNAQDKAAFNETLESLQPTVDRGYIKASEQARQVLNRRIDNRIDMLHGGRALEKPSSSLVSGSRDYVSGKSSKRTPQADEYTSSQGGVWAKPYIHSASQSGRDGIAGYELSAQGVTIGADTGMRRDGVIIGVAAIAGTANIDSQNANVARTDTESYGLSVYGGNRFPKNTVLSGSATYIHNTNEMARRSVGGISGNTLSSNYTNQHIALRSRLSRPYRTHKNIMVIPSASLGYDYLDTETYTESGNSDLALTVRTEDIHKVNVGVGARVIGDAKAVGRSRVQPSAYLNFDYNVLNDGVKADSNLRVAPEQRFSTKSADPQKATLSIGGELAAEITEDWRVTAGYDFEYQHKYGAHTGYVNAVHDF